ncbi:MAG: hypothetical protein RL748_289 [Pseudomonadota bacterium]|jgi:hypothetical protein
MVRQAATVWASVADIQERFKETSPAVAASPNGTGYTYAMSADSTHFSYAKRVLVFCLATLLLHWGALNWASRHLARPGELAMAASDKAVQVQLRPAKTQPVAPAASAQPAQAARQPKPARPRPAQGRSAPATESPLAPEPVTQAQNSNAPPPAPEAPSSSGPAHLPAEPAVPANLASAATNEASNPAAPPVVPDASRYGFDIPPSMEVKYAVRKFNRKDDSEHPTTGRGSIRWINQGGQYQIEGEFKFLFFTFFSFKSEGEVDMFGLAPQLYAEKRGNRALTNTHFQRDNRIISFSASSRQIPLQDGAQDRASILWQLTAIARAEHRNFSANTVIDALVAGERRADVWSFKVLGSEMLKLDNKQLEAWHLAQIPPPDSYERRIDVWLSPQHHFVPVQIMYSESNGGVLQMSMTDAVVLSGGEH